MANKTKVWRIPLTQGKFALVDEGDFEYLSQLKWWIAKGGYAISWDRVRKKTVLMHRLLLDCPKNLYVDHINGDKLDNRRSNIRVATKADNNRNVGRRSNNKSGYKGVYLDRQRGLFVADIRFRGKTLHLGRYRTILEAARVYNRKSLELFGEFSRPNNV